jgi:hypothetical protein
MVSRLNHSWVVFPQGYKVGVHEIDGLNAKADGVVFSANKVVDLAGVLPLEFAREFFRELSDVARPFREGQERAERAVFEKYERMLHPPSGSRPEDFPEGSDMRHQMEAPVQQKPRPSMETK